MITLQQFMELVDYKISDGCPYKHTSYSDLYCLFTADNEKSFYVIFDSSTKKVYYAEVYDNKKDQSYLLVESGFDIGVERDDSYESSTLEVDDDFLEKAMAIKEGREYDHRIMTILTFTDEEWFKYAMMAHERDITLNKMIESLLTEGLEYIRANPDAL